MLSGPWAGPRLSCPLQSHLALSVRPCGVDPWLGYRPKHIIPSSDPSCCISEVLAKLLVLEKGFHVIERKLHDLEVLMPTSVQVASPVADAELKFHDVLTPIASTLPAKRVAKHLPSVGTWWQQLPAPRPSSVSSPTLLPVERVIDYTDFICEKNGGIQHFEDPKKMSAVNSTCSTSMSQLVNVETAMLINLLPDESTQPPNPLNCPTMPPLIIEKIANPINSLPCESIQPPNPLICTTIKSDKSQLVNEEKSIAMPISVKQLTQQFESRPMTHLDEVGYSSLGSVRCGHPNSGAEEFLTAQLPDHPVQASDLVSDDDYDVGCFCGLLGTVGFELCEVCQACKACCCSCGKLACHSDTLVPVCDE